MLAISNLPKIVSAAALASESKEVSNSKRIPNTAKE